jgi:hypothetical protein
MIFIKKIEIKNINSEDFCENIPTNILPKVVL